MLNMKVLHCMRNMVSGHSDLFAGHLRLFSNYTGYKDRLYRYILLTGTTAGFKPCNFIDDVHAVCYLCEDSIAEIAHTMIQKRVVRHIDEKL